jgi:hypothetical protein
VILIFNIITIWEILFNNPQHAAGKTKSKNGEVVALSEDEK